MNPTEDIKAHEAEQIKASYKLADKEQPDTEIDLAILNAAKIVINEQTSDVREQNISKPIPLKKVRNIFLIPLSLAASLMICVSVVLYVDNSIQSQSETLIEAKSDSLMLEEKLQDSPPPQNNFRIQNIAKENDVKEKVSKQKMGDSITNQRTLSKEEAVASPSAAYPKDNTSQYEQTKPQPLLKSRQISDMAFESDRSDKEHGNTQQKNKADRSSISPGKPSSASTLSGNSQPETKKSISSLHEGKETESDSFDHDLLSDRKNLNMVLSDIQIDQLIQILELLERYDTKAAELELLRFNEKYNLKSQIKMNEVKDILINQNINIINSN